MINVYLYNFSKRINSTRRPSGGQELSGQIDNNSGVNSPSIIIDFGDESPAAYNYMYIPSFNRYYWVEWSRTENGFWITSSTCDVLASFKNQIGSSSQYILRSSAEYDGKVYDSLYPTINSTHRNIQYGSSNPLSGVEGEYVLGVISKNENGVSQLGAVTYYVMTPTQITNFFRFMLGSDEYLGVNWDNITSFTSSLFKGFFNPFQYIVSLMWLPYNVVSGSSIPVQFGWWNSTVSASQLVGASQQFNFSINVDKHPQSLSRGEYLNLSPFSSYMLNVRPFGTFPLNTLVLSDYDEILCNLRVDNITGKGILKVTGNDGTDILYTTAQVGVPLQIAQMSQDMIRTSMVAIQSYVSASGSSSSSKKVSENVSNVLSNALSGIQNVTETAMPQLAISGASGSIAEFNAAQQPSITSEFVEIADEDNSNLGRPLCKVRSISSIPGYIMCNEADIEIDGSLEECVQIKSYMNGGFFYE